MKKLALTTLLLSLTMASTAMADTLGSALGTAPAPAAKTTSPFTTEQAKLSYVFGFNIGTGMRMQQVQVDQSILAKGLADGLASAQPQMAPADMQATLTAFEKQMMAKQKAAFDAASGKNLTDGSAFMKANAAKPGVKSLENGQLQYRVITAGKGAMPKATDTVEITYEGKLVNGNVFDSTARNGNKPANLGVNQMIPGMQKLLTMMPVGSTWELVIAPSMAYGPKGVPMSPIGPNETLVFNLTLNGIVKK